jgi:hypothetical protein
MQVKMADFTDPSAKLRRRGCRPTAALSDWPCGRSLSAKISDRQYCMALFAVAAF